MDTLNDLRDRLRRRLIACEGNASQNDLIDIVEEARALGLNEGQIARLVPEVDRSINWDQIRAEKEAAARLAGEEAERQRHRQQQIDAAPEYLQALLRYNLAEGKLEAATLQQIFQKAVELEQSLPALAVQIKTELDARNFWPHPNVDLQAPNMQEMLLSTSWYSAHLFSQLEPENKKEAPEPEALSVVSFAADAVELKKGGHTNLRWKVTGAGSIHITPLGTTEQLHGYRVVHPKVTTRYTLIAGAEVRTVEIVVVQSSPKTRIKRILLWVLGIYLLLRLLVMAAPVPGIPLPVRRSPNTVVLSANSIAGPLVAGQVGAVNLSKTEEAAVVGAINHYLQEQSRSSTAPAALNALCRLYAYPVAPYFSESSAGWTYVYKDVKRYRKNFQFEGWKLDPTETHVRKLPDGTYQVDLAGLFSYQVRAKKHTGYKQRYVRQRCLLTADCRVKSVYELN